MALKAIIHKAQIQISDMDRQVYADHSVTIARHPSETDERMLVRLLAFALNVPHDDHRGALQFARGLSDGDEPDLWQHDLTGQLLHWVEVGQPDERRLAKACSRAERVTLYVFGSAAGIWWNGIRNKLTRLNKLSVWQIPSEQAQALSRLASRSMQWQVTVQDGHVWVNSGEASLELLPQRLMGPS